MKSKSILVATVAVLSLTVNAVAQQGGSEEERQACSPDVKKFCAAVIDQGDIVILSCLQQNRQKLSKACNQVLVNHGQ